MKWQTAAVNHSVRSIGWKKTAEKPGASGRRVFPHGTKNYQEAPGCDRYLTRLFKSHISSASGNSGR